MTHTVTPPDRRELAVTLGVVVSLHVAAAALLVLGHRPGTGALTLGTVAVAWLAGLKHHADADHLTGIAGATRAFVAGGRAPASVGLAFALGHSTVVFLLCCAVAWGVGGAGELLTGDSGVADALGVVGGLVAGGFLVLVGVVNAVVLHRSRAAGGADGGRTVTGRLMARPLAAARGPRDVYLVGFLFGLGFDTATQIGLLVLTATSASLGVPAVALLALPLAFAAGMTAGDTAVGLVLLRTYLSAGTGHTRGSTVDLVVTAMSAASALTLGTVLLGATAGEAGWSSDPVTGALAALDLDAVGWVVLAVVLVTTAVVWALDRGAAARRLSVPRRTRR